MLSNVIVSSIEYIGIVAFSVGAAISAMEKRIDAVGVVLLSIITSLGGGVMRDLILGHIPPTMFVNYGYTLVATLSALVTFCIAFITKEKFRRHEIEIDKVSNIFDALGLGAFSVIAVDKAIACGYEDNILLVMSVCLITGIGGGIMRDCMIGEIPKVLQKRVYALAALLGGAVYYALYIFGANTSISAPLAIAATFILRMLATKYRWNIPRAF